MSSDPDAEDSIAETVVSGSSQERAKLLADRVFPLSVTWKIRVCILTCSLGVLFAPAIAARQNLVSRLEGLTGAAAFHVALGDVALVGAVVTFGVGVLFLRQRRRFYDDSLDVDTAKRLLRIEDMLMTVAVSNGVLFVLTPVALVGIAIVRPGLIPSLYEAGVSVYQSSTVAIDARLVSVASALFAVVLWSLEYRTRPVE